MSLHKAEVIRIQSIRQHPNADTLGIISVDGFEVCFRLEDFNEGDLVVFVEPDSVVPNSGPFAFLNGSCHIKARKFRGRYSQGLLVPAPEGVKEGDDVMEQMGITHYEPPIPMSIGGDNEKGPPGFYPKYDVENYKRYGHLFKDGEPVIVTEKLHGCNSRFCHVEGRLWCGSRTNWKKEDEKNVWWQAAKQNPEIEQWCKDNPGLAVYGEVFGNVQKLKYGAKNGQFFFAAFDILDKDHWLNYSDARLVGRGLPWVPELYRGPFDKEKLNLLAEGPSTIEGANHIREGIVICPEIERNDPEVGRVQLKIVSNAYLAKS